MSPQAIPYHGIKYFPPYSHCSCRLFHIFWSLLPKCATFQDGFASNWDEGCLMLGVHKHDVLVELGGENLHSGDWDGWRQWTLCWSLQWQSKCTRSWGILAEEQNSSRGTGLDSCWSDPCLLPKRVLSMSSSQDLDQILTHAAAEVPRGKCVGLASFPRYVPEIPLKWQVET